MLGIQVCTIVLGSPTYLLNSGSFSRSSRAEWQVIRVRSNCVISSGRVLPIWFSASQVHSAAQPLPQLISVITFIFLSALPRLAYRFWSSGLSFPHSWNIDVDYTAQLFSHFHTQRAREQAIGVPVLDQNCKNSVPTAWLLQSFCVLGSEQSMAPACPTNFILNAAVEPQCWKLLLFCLVWERTLVL